MRLIHFHRKNELCEKYRLTALLALGLGFWHVSVAFDGRVEIKDQGGSNEISSLKEGVCPLFFYGMRYVYVLHFNEFCKRMTCLESSPSPCMKRMLILISSWQQTLKNWLVKLLLYW